MYMYLITALICIVIVVVVAAILVCGNLFAEEESGVEISNTSIPQAESTDESVEETSIVIDDGMVDVTGYKEISIQSSALTEGDLLLIKNTADAAAPNQDSLVLTNIYSNKQGSKYSLSSAELLLNSDALTALNLMMQGFNTATADTNIMVNDAFVSIATLIADDNLSTYADLASGRAVRLTVFPSSYGKMGEGVYLWLAEHCHEYGYIVRYPADKTEKTGVAASAAIYRYVGVPHAMYMKENNLSLEEYHELLKGHDYKKPLKATVSSSGEEYYVYYQSAVIGTSTAISVPGDKAYTVSGNSSDGFIITVSVNTLSD